MVSSLIYAAPFTISIEGLPEPTSKIQSFLITLEVDGDFNVTDFAFGDAIPTDGKFGWLHTPLNVDTTTSRRLYKIEGIDQDGLYFGDFHDMRNGVISTFNYEGSILGVAQNALLISNRTGDNQIDNLGLTYKLSSESLMISSVPIPGAFYLLSSGLLGLVGIRRRMKRS